jgi:hypothetical protein
MYKGRTKEKALDNGFVYPIISGLINFIEKLNIVNLFKFVAVLLTKWIYVNKSEDSVMRLIRRNRNIAVDFFIVAKFTFIGLIWLYKINNIYNTIFVIYLLVMNSFTYFYYHVWEETAILNQFQTLHRVRRRFINLIISIMYMIFTYAYLYAVPYAQHFKWGDGEPSFVMSFLFSVSNSFNGGYNIVGPTSEFGELIKSTEIVAIFVFVVIVLARSLPQGSTK